MKIAVFLERDGILNVTTKRNGQPVSPLTFGEFELNPAAAEPLNRLREAGLVLIATTNQPGISQGVLRRRELDLMHDYLNREFDLDEILVCPHDGADECPCRKPRAGMLHEAAFKWHLDLDHSYVVSDKWQDARAAHLAGCTSLLLESPWTESGHRDFLLPSLDVIATKIIEMHGFAQRIKPMVPQFEGVA